MVIDIKMCRFENVPWGFRLVGGSDFEYPLTVVKVTEGSIAEEAGLCEGDVIVRINDTPTSPLTHDETNKIIKHCGNVFIIGIQRESEQLENAPKHFPILGLERPSTPLGFVEVTSKSPIPPASVEGEPLIEYVPEPEQERPCSVLSEATEIKLVEEEIAAVLSGESEVLKEHDVMGIFPKPGVCMSSDVLRTLNEEAVKTKAEKDKDNKKWSTFLQKPDRPIPKSKEQLEAERRAANAYKVKIVKSAPRSRSVSPMPSRAETVPPTAPETPAADVEKQQTPPKVEEEIEEPPPTDSEVPNLEEVKIVIEPPTTESEEDKAVEQENTLSAATEQIEIADNDTVNGNDEEKRDEQEKCSTAADTEEAVPLNASNANVVAQSEKTAEELALERQLADVQRQLAALSSLPSTIQATLDAVTKQLAELVPAFKLQQVKSTNAEATSEVRAINLEQIDESAEQTTEQPGTTATEEKPQQENAVEENENEENAEHTTVDAELAALDDNRRQVAQQEMRHLEEEQTLKKQKRNEIIEELEEQLEERKGIARQRSKRAFGPLTPSSERPLVLPGGRRWYRPKDAYNDEFIAETLSAQAELITGTTLGCTFESPLLPYDPRVNFMKYQKPERKIDLNRSEVYKVIHHLDRQPVRGIEVRPPVVPAEVDIRQVAVQP